MAYEVKNGEVVKAIGNDNKQPVRLKVFELSELMSSVIPNGTPTDDVMHACNMLMGEAVARRGSNLQDRKRIAEAFHIGLIRGLELNATVEARVKALKAKLLADGKQPSQEEFREMIAVIMKDTAEEIRNVAASRPIDGGIGTGVVHDVGVSETAAPHDIAGHVAPKDVLQ